MPDDAKQPGYATLATTARDTLGGRFLRRFWHPFARKGDLGIGEATRVEVMNDAYTFARLAPTQHTLLPERCPHRGMPLHLGEVSEHGVRCPYHGWSFDAAGACTSAPGEPERFAATVSLECHPIREAFGLWFGYFGPGAPPPFPYEGVAMDGLVPYRMAPIHWPCNFMLRLENTADVTHLGGIHRTSGLDAFLPATFSLALTHESTGYLLRVESTSPELGAPFRYLYPNRFQYRQPFMPEMPWLEHLTWHVPTNDGSTCTWTVILVPTDDPEALFSERPEPRESDRSIVEAALRVVHHEGTLADLRGHPNLTEIEDCVAVCAQHLAGGPLPSQLGSADAGVEAIRAILDDEIHRFDAGAAFSGAIAINRDTWDGLPEEVQAAMVEAGKAYTKAHGQDLVERHEFALNKMVELGANQDPPVTIVVMPQGEREKWVNMMPDLAADWAAPLDERGIPAKDFLNAYMAGLKARGVTPVRDWTLN